MRVKPLAADPCQPLPADPGCEQLKLSIRGCGPLLLYLFIDRHSQLALPNILPRFPLYFWELRTLKQALVLPKNGLIKRVDRRRHKSGTAAATSSARTALTAAASCCIAPVAAGAC
jgi:hypothetical protein